LAARDLYADRWPVEQLPLAAWGASATALASSNGVGWRGS
jgi:hypothetical protein